MRGRIMFRLLVKNTNNKLLVKNTNNKLLVKNTNNELLVKNTNNEPMNTYRPAKSKLWIWILITSIVALIPWVAIAMGWI